MNGIASTIASVLGPPVIANAAESGSRRRGTQILQVDVRGA
jgi:hypothetical protein